MRKLKERKVMRIEIDAKWYERLRKLAERDHRTMVGQVQLWIEREEKAVFPIIKF